MFCCIWFSLVLCLPSVLWHCWLGHLTRKNPSPIWPRMFLVGHKTLLNSTQLCRVTQSSDSHRTESVSVMDHKQTMGVNSRVLDQKQQNIFGCISGAWNCKVTPSSWTEVTTRELCELDNIYHMVPFENTTSTNQNKKVKIKERRAGWSG